MLLISSPLLTRITLAFTAMLIFCISYSQDLPCNRKVDVFYRFTKFMIDEPQDRKMLKEYSKIQVVDQMLIQQIKSRSSMNLVPIVEGLNYTKQHGYVFEGLILYDATEYALFLMFKSTCGEEVLAQSKVSFQMYPSWDPAAVVKKAVGQLLGNIDVAKIEDDRRDAKNYALGGDVWGGRISIKMNTKLVKGEQTKVELRVVDCDGVILNNKEIRLDKTVGGTFTPAKVKTNAEGIATATFRMNSDKTAVVKAQCETKNVWECKDLFTGTELVKAVGGLPVKVEITYSQTELKWVKPLTLPGVKIKGGQESELTDMRHTAVLYHYPTEQARKKGYLVDSETDPEDPGSKTEHITEQGWFIYSKNVMARDLTAGEESGFTVHDKEEGEKVEYVGDASVDYPSKVTLALGEGGNPPMFNWDIEYPASNDGIAGASVSFSKDDPGVKWNVRKVNDPKSPYKTEYVLQQNIDIAKEYQEGENIMAGTFGMTLDDIAGKIDPNNPQKNVAGQNGFRNVTVRILSPY